MTRLEESERCIGRRICFGRRVRGGAACCMDLLSLLRHVAVQTIIVDHSACRKNCCVVDDFHWEEVAPTASDGTGTRGRERYEEECETDAQLRLGRLNALVDEAGSWD